MAKPEGFEQSDSDPLPYTQVDRAVKAKAALLAGKLNVTSQHALGSLVEFWDLNGDPRDLEKLVAKGIDKVVLNAAEVRIRFELASGKTVEPVALVALGVLEQEAPDAFRVRGMSRFFAPVKARLQARHAASLGGKASAEARRKKAGTAQPEGGRGSKVGSEAGSESASEVAQAETEATTEPETEAERKPEATQRSAVSGQRSAVTSKVAGAKKNAPAAQGDQPVLVDVKPTPTKTDTDPRHAPLVKALTDARPGYDFTGRDAKAIVNLLNKAEKVAPGRAAFEVVLRWRRALASEAYPRVRAIHELDANWNHFASDGPAPRGPADPLTQNHTRESENEF